MNKILLLCVALTSSCSATVSAPGTFLCKLENAVSNADPVAFHVAFADSPQRERNLTGQWLWTMFIENKRIKRRLEVKYEQYRLPHDYQEKRMRLLSLLFQHDFVRTDSLARGKHTLQAVMANEPEALTLLLENGFSLDVVDARGDTPLSWAVREGYNSCARKILDVIEDDLYRYGHLLLYKQSYSPFLNSNLLQLMRRAPYLIGEAENRAIVQEMLTIILEGHEESKNSSE